MRAIISIIIMVLVLIPASAMAAGSWTEESPVEKNGVVYIELNFTADAADGSVPDKEITIAKGHPAWGRYLYRVVTDPGTTAPTDNYDITIDDTDGLDMCGGDCANRDTSTTEKVQLVLFEPVLGNVTVTVSNNSVNSATGMVRLVFVP